MGATCSRFTPTRDEEQATNEAKLAATKLSYETDALMSQYLSLHFGPADAAFAAFASEAGLLQDALDFPRKCGDLVLRWQQQAPRPVGTGRALDLGCAVGRAAFEMARAFDSVVGVDLSQTFVDMAERMRSEGRLEYALRVEGDVTQPVVATIPAGVDAARVRFAQGDACALPESGLGQFDAVLAANLLCRVPDPAACLAGIAAALNPNGLLVLTSPFTWLEEYTARAKWIGGTVSEDGKQVLRSADALKALMRGLGFEVLEEGSIPLVIRETARKYQLILAHKLVLQKSGGGAGGGAAAAQ